MLRKPTFIKRLLIVMMVVGASKAQEPDKIRAVVAALNQARFKHDAKAVAQFFTSDGELRVGGALIGIGPAAIERALKQPDIWSEVSGPAIEVQSIRMLSRNTAIVDAVQNRYGSIILKQSTPVTLLLKRSRGQWKVTSLNETSPPSVKPRL